MTTRTVQVIVQFQVEVANDLGEVVGYETITGTYPQAQLAQLDLRSEAVRAADAVWQRLPRPEPSA